MDLRRDGLHLRHGLRRPGFESNVGLGYRRQGNERYAERERKSCEKPSAELGDFHKILHAEVFMA